MEKDIRKKLSEIQDCIESAEWDLNNATDELNDLWDKLAEQSDKGIKDLNNFKRELKRDGLYSQKIEEFLENYMKYYNK
jgi:hypothetical protein